MDAQCRECLRCPLAKSNITYTIRPRGIQNILYRVWYIMPCEIVNAVIPELDGVRTMVERFL